MNSTQFSGEQCVVCGDSAVPAPAPFPAVCKDLDCRNVVNKQQTMPAFHFQCYLAAQSQRIRTARASKKAELKRLALERAERKKIKVAAEATDERIWRDKVQPLLDAYIPVNSEKSTATQDALPGLIIPKGPRVVVVASDERREIHAVYLTTIIQEMDREIDLPIEENLHQAQNQREVSQSLAIGLCTACAGGCCTKGGNAAYLTAQTMRRVRADFPDISPDDLQQLYLARLPSESMAGSCIYHTTQGCALPRELRSDTCNNYACEAFKALPTKSRVDKASTTKVLIFQRRQDKWRQSAVDLDNSIMAAYLLDEDDTILLHELP